MDSHRLVSSDAVEIISVASPFSSFSYIEINFGSSIAIHRCFSLARSSNFQTLVSESIPETDTIKDENVEICSYFPDHKMTGLKRLSFWSSHFESGAELQSMPNEDLIGYVILKKDKLPSKNVGFWHVFEAIFCKYSHRHNCIPRAPSYELKVCNKSFYISGVLYCQQNQLNKVCAHVALRSLLSRLLPEGDILYSKINELAKSVTPATYKPSNGLNPEQIQAILTGLGVSFRAIDYSTEDAETRKQLPYQKYLYAGVESGAGALLGFKFTGPSAAEESRHIIPFYGHTFNKDTWAPDAELGYFKVSRNLGYVPSESWTSSFIGHDDNFGPNFCVPRLYITPEQAEYVVELLHDGFKVSGMQAEALTLSFLYSLNSHIIATGSNIWVKKLVEEISTGSQKVVFRAIAVSSEQYLKHLSTISDWDGNKEAPQISIALKPVLPDWLWVIEVSLPQLFSANERKLGEVVLDPYKDPSKEELENFNLFLFARVPDHYFILSEVSSGKPEFLTIPSNFKSHTALLTF